MSRATKLEGLNFTLLSLIHDGLHYTDKLANKTGKSQVVVTQHLNTLEGWKFIKRLKQGRNTEILLTPLGESIARMGSNNISIAVGEHSLMLKFDLRNRLAPNMPAKVLQIAKIEYEPVSLRNQSSCRFVYSEYQVLLTPASLTLYCPRYRAVVNQDLDVITPDMIRRAMEVALDLEARLGISIRRASKGMLYATVVKMHIPLVGHPFAQMLEANGGVRYIYDKDSKDLKLAADMSTGPLPELEPVNSRTAIPDAKNLLANSAFLAKYDLQELLGNLNRELESLKGVNKKVR